MTNNQKRWIVSLISDVRAQHSSTKRKFRRRYFPALTTKFGQNSSGSVSVAIAWRESPAECQHLEVEAALSAGNKSWQHTNFYRLVFRYYATCSAEVIPGD
jgi:hypothetical protein